MLDHPFAHALAAFFRAFPIPFRDEHVHLSGSLDAEFIYPRLAPLLEQEEYRKKIVEVHGKESLPIRSAADVDRLIRLGDDDRFSRYLKILYLPKLTSPAAMPIARPRTTWPAASTGLRTSARCG